jgi:hypothetical protein
MAYSIKQQPTTVALSQSPIVFSVEETDTNVTATGSFQYFGDLYYWQGGSTNQGSVPNYTFAKYPNQSNTGIFDVSKVINSLFTQSVQENPSQVYYYALDTYYGYRDSSNNFVTSSHVQSSTRLVIDGYGLWGEDINESITLKTPHYPLLTDGPDTQSFNDGDQIDIYVYSQGVDGVLVDELYVTDDSGTTEYTISGSQNTSEQIQKITLTPTNTDTLTVQGYYLGSPLGTPITYDRECTRKYDPIRVKYKNRYGTFDYFNFNLVSKQTFNVSRQQYQPQLGQWEAGTFSYEQYESQTQNYLIDTDQTMVVNTDYVSEDYNELFKQMLVSDEIYWIYDIVSGEEQLRPLTIQTSNLTFKTGQVDKLIQYTLQFRWGVPYKLAL